MTTSILINALGQALFESCGQALLIYIALQLFMQLFPAVSSKYRYDVNYLGLVIICCWFLANLVKIYLHNMAMPHYSAQLYNNMVYTPKPAPTLLQQTEAFISTYAKYITGLYMIGLMLHAFKLLGGLVHIHHIRKQKNLTQDSLWTAKALELGKKLKIAKRVSLYLSGHVNIPLTIGHFKPIIIFPLALINNLDTEQVEAILLHELAHIKRHDYLLNILQCIMETILCFNPFVWLISKTIRTEREYCCDDMVVEDEECNHFTYAKALFVIAQQNNQSYTLAMASTGSKKYPLLNRIKRLNTMKTQDSLPKFHLLIVLAVAAIGTILAWGIPQYSLAKSLSNKNTKAIVHHLNIQPLAVPAPVVAVSENINASPATHKITAVKIYTDTASNTKVNDSTINPSKARYKIVIEDNGVQREYSSIDELPAKDKEEFLKENPTLGTFNFKMIDSVRFASMEKLKMNPEWQKQMADMRARFDSPEWHRQMDEITREANNPKTKREIAEIKAQFDSPEWHKQMEDMKARFDSPEWKKQVEDMKARFDSPEWHKQMEDMKAQFDSPEWRKQMEDMKVEQEKMSRQFNSPKWKKQMVDMKVQNERMRKMMNSPAWKKQQDEFRKEADEMRKRFDSPEWHKQMEDMQKKMMDQINESRDKAIKDSVKTAN